MPPNPNKALLLLDQNIELTAKLGFGPQELLQLKQLPHQLIPQRVKELKATVAKRYKQLAFDQHPDRNPDNPNATKEFATLAAVKDVLVGLDIRIQPPRPRPVQWVIRPQTTVIWSTGTSTSTTTTGAW